MTKPDFTHTHRCTVKYHDWTCKKKECFGQPVGSRKPKKDAICPDCLKTMHGGEPETHESYGMISVSRFQSSAQDKYFGSAVKFSGGISLEIQTAKKYRNLSHDNYHADKTLVRVRLTPTQFADMITNMNMHGGVPCTIERFDGKGMSDPPDTAFRQQYVNEFEEKIEKAFDLYDSLADDIEKYFATGRGSRVEIRDKLATLRRELQNNAPFILDQFNRGIEKIVTEAKAEVQTFIEAKIRSVGIEAMESELRSTLAAPLASEALQLPAAEEKKD